MCSSNILSDSFFVVLGMYVCECMFIDVKLFSIPPSISTPICLTTMTWCRLFNDENKAKISHFRGLKVSI